MKNLNLYIRRIHLYLSMALLPWFLMYGVSAVFFNHEAYFTAVYGDWSSKWGLRFEREYSKNTSTNAELRDVAKEMMEELGIPVTAYSVSRKNQNQLHIYVWDFKSTSRILYDEDQGRVRVEDVKFRWDDVFKRVHARGGFLQDSVLNDVWGVLVDLFSLAMITWVVTGIYMWWNLKPVRVRGGLAIAAGIVTFALFLYLL